MHREIRWVRHVVSVAWEDRRQAVFLCLFHCRQDLQSVINRHVVPGRIPLCNRIRLLFLMNIDQHTAIDCVLHPGALDLARWNYHIVIGKNDCQSLVPKVPARAERVKAQRACKR